MVGKGCPNPDQTFQAALKLKQNFMDSLMIRSRGDFTADLPETHERWAGKQFRRIFAGVKLNSQEFEQIPEGIMVSKYLFWAIFFAYRATKAKNYIFGNELHKVL